MIEALVVFLYLGIVLYIGIFAFRKTKGTGEDYFLASRSLGTFVFLFSLFGTNMTSVAILGSSGKAFGTGIGIYGLMASASSLIIPLTIFLIGTRVWAMGKRFGHMTPVQIFRGRWEAGHIGTAVFGLQAVLLVPYIIVGVEGGGTTLSTISGGLVPEWLGGGLVALVVMSYVFFGGMRGTAWVNTFQTILFLTFGLIAIAVIWKSMGGFAATVERMLAETTHPATANAPHSLSHLLSREKLPGGAAFWFSYTFIPLSAITFPHICIFCLTAKRMDSFKKTVILYPLCIMAIWFPCVFLGTLAASDPAIHSAIDASGKPDEVMLLLLKQHAPVWLAGVLGAGIMAAVMASDSQILALSTMFTEDFFAYYGGKDRFGEKVQILTGRIFIVGVTVVAYAIAMATDEGIFDIATQFAFTGYAALSPLMIAAVFWKRSTKWGALGSTLVVAAGIALISWLFNAYPAPKGPPTVIWSVADTAVLSRTKSGISFLGGYLPVMPLTILSALAMVVGSLLTRPPSRETVARYFPSAPATPR